MYGKPPRRPEDECPCSNSGHYARRIGRMWVCTHCGMPVKSYDGPLPEEG